MFFELFEDILKYAREHAVSKYFKELIHWKYIWSMCFWKGIFLKKHLDLNTNSVFLQRKEAFQIRKPSGWNFSLVDKYFSNSLPLIC